MTVVHVDLEHQTMRMSDSHTVLIFVWNFHIKERNIKKMLLESLLESTLLCI